MADPARKTVLKVALDCVERLSDAGATLAEALAGMIDERGEVASEYEQEAIANFVRVQRDVAARLQELRA